MRNEIVVDISRGDTRVAVLEEGELVELYIQHQHDIAMIGNIYKGNVVRVLPGMQAAFVDIGYDKNAFLYIKPKKGEKTDITKHVQVGSTLTVQVLKEPIGTKGPRVTTGITLPGRFMVLLPNANHVSVSKKIENEEERQRLIAIGSEIKPKNMGLIMRTQAKGQSKEQLANEVYFLIKMWHIFMQENINAEAPMLIHDDADLLYRSVRDLFTYQTDTFVINALDEYRKVITWLDMLAPSLKQRVVYFGEQHSIFEKYHIESKISKLLYKKVWLKCGGYIVIDPTEALTAIDVNTGKYVGNTDLEQTVLDTNLQAAEEVARQLRLRDIGGIIVIDFIDMHSKEHKKQVIDILKHYIKRDRTKTTVEGTTRLGLVEMTRKKIRERLSVFLKNDCPHCNGSGKVVSPETVVRLVEKEIHQIFSSSLTKTIHVYLHPDTAAVFEGEDKNHIHRLQQIFEGDISVLRDSALKLHQYRIDTSSA